MPRGFKVPRPPKGHFITRAKSRDRKIVRAQKKVFNGRPKTPPKIM